MATAIRLSPKCRRPSGQAGIAAPPGYDSPWTNPGPADLKSRTAKGFTLIELIMAIALLAIFIALAVPSFFTAIQNNRITVQSNDLLTAFHLARSEALKRNQPVVVCASEDGLTCDGDWTDGWIVAEDSATPGAGAPTIVRVLRVWSGPPGGFEITGPDVLRFLPRGSMDAAMGVTFPATVQVRVDGCRGDQARDILIDRSGRVASERLACP